MASKLVMSGLVFLLFCFALEDGAKGRKSSVEDDELESQFQLINKPSIKTIKRGLNFWKNDSKNQSDSGAMYSLAELRSEPCSSSSIPMRRIEKDDLIEWKYFSSKPRNQSKISHPLDSTPKYHWAMMQSVEHKYLGASAWLNIAGLPQVASDQFSGTSISMMNGAGEDHNIMTVGWMVYPALYGDTQTRLTIFWMTSGNRYCYNLQCPDFHQTNTKIKPGAVLSDQGDDRFLTFTIYKEYKTGYWWFTITHRNGEEQIGYWPSSVFSSLKDYATFVYWGGMANSPSNEKSPPMGNGRFASNNGARAIQIKMIDGDGMLLLPTGQETFIADKPECYDTSKLDYDRDAKYNFRFGGPGGCLG